MQYLDSFDKVMPVMNRIDATVAIRKLGEFGKNVCIIGVTGNALAEDLAQFIAAGCNEVCIC